MLFAIGADDEAEGFMGMHYETTENDLPKAHLSVEVIKKRCCRNMCDVAIYNS